MDRTLKDSSRLQSTPSVYEIVKRQDGTFDILQNGDVTNGSIPEQWLEDEMAKYGICGTEYISARRQLNERGTAKLSF
jgi:hypothetical protein